MPNKLFDLINKIASKSERHIIGLMSGTSVDGLDVALVNIAGSGKEMSVRLLEHRVYDYPANMVNEIKSCFSSESGQVDKICELNFWLGSFYADKVLEFLKEIKLQPADVDCIASHGQTIHHLPHGKFFNTPSTLQIGELDVVAYKTKILTIGDFRTKDVSANGQGAPLVSYMDYILYSDDEKTIAVNNLGGISNLTYLPKKCSKDDVIAFDTGPANALIDLVAEKFFGVSYDKNGEFAARGKINEELLKVLMTIEEPFVDLKPPKTTGKEIYNLQYLEKATRSFEKINRYDLIATITFFTAWSIYENYRRHIIPKGLDTVYFNGGGVKNTTLMNHLKIFFEKANVKIAVDERFSKAKEAVCMAILAHEFLNGVSNNVPSATGAKESVVCGKIALPF